jgi:hypothetical protein
MSLKFIEYCQQKVVVQAISTFIILFCFHLDLQKKSYGLSSVDGIAGGNIKNQHRAYLESQPPLKYFFEAGKINGPFPAGITDAQQYVRKQFLEMYKLNSGYFLTTNTLDYWRNVSNIADLQLGQGDRLLGFFESVSENSSFLNYIIVK